MMCYRFIQEAYGMDADQIRSLQPALAVLLERFRPCFKREATFAHWQRYLLGLMADLKRKSIEPIALAAGVAVRTLQEFLAFFVWDHERVKRILHHLVVDEHGSDHAIGVIDSCGHPKQGGKTPGVQRQWCGERGKRENCIVGQHLLYTDNHSTNPFSCMLASDLFLPESWAADRDRCRAAGIPSDVGYRPKWRIAIDQLSEALGHGVRFSWVTFDEEYGSIQGFWFALDRLGLRAAGEVSSQFRCWPTLPKYGSLRGPHASKEVKNVCRYSPVFTKQRWCRIRIKDGTRGPVVWEVRAARVHLVDASGPRPSKPTDRLYWLIHARKPQSREIKYVVSNAPVGVSRKQMLSVMFGRWHVEKWFERAKQESGFGAFEVRTYTSLIRHWTCSSMVMYFLADQTQRLREKKYTHHTGAGRRRGKYPGVEDLEPLAKLVG